MDKLSETDVEGFFTFHCIGCGYDHHINTNPNFAGGKVWSFNGDMKKPTAQPSLLVNSHTDKRCHLFVTDGKLVYLSDCWHQYAGQTLEMLDAD